MSTPYDSCSSAMNYYISFEGSLVCSMTYNPTAAPHPWCSVRCHEMSWNGHGGQGETSPVCTQSGMEKILVSILHGSFMSTLVAESSPLWRDRWWVSAEAPSNVALSRKLMVDTGYMIRKTYLNRERSFSVATLLSLARITRQQASQGPSALSNMEPVVRPLELSIHRL